VKLILSVINAEDVRNLVRALLERGHRATLINTTGGFLRRGNATVLCATADSQVPSVLNIIRRNCCARVEHLSPLDPDTEPEELYIPASVEVGGATVFILDIERFEQYSRDSKPSQHGIQRQNPLPEEALAAGEDDSPGKGLVE
jgi:uncharacterized protein YaaQ